MKKAVVIFLGCALLVLSACSLQTGEDVCTENQASTQQFATTHFRADSTCKTDSFKHNAIEFEYPQIVDMEDKDKQSSINEFISSFVMDMIKYDAPEGFDSFEFLNVTYEVALRTSDIMCIVFSGDSKLIDGRPGPYMRALTFKVDTLEVMKLSDFVNLDAAFATKVYFLDRIWNLDGPVDLDIDNFVQHLRPKQEDIPEFFDDPLLSEKYFYVTADSIGILLSGLVGEYYWVEVDR